MKTLLLIPIALLVASCGAQFTLDVPVGDQTIPVTVVLPEK